MNMRISILPKSTLGKWSVGLAAAFILVAVVDGLLVYLAVVEHPTGSVSLMILGTVVAILVIGAIVTGLISIIKSKERSILVFLVVIAGFFVSLFLPGFWIPSWEG